MKSIQQSALSLVLATGASAATVFSDTGLSTPLAIADHDALGIRRNLTVTGLTLGTAYDVTVSLDIEGRGYGGMLSFEIKNADKALVFRFMEALELCLPATTLGDVYSLVLHPATASHRALTPEERARVGIPDGLVRLSAGIEDVDDILADLEQALSKI